MRNFWSKRKKNQKSSQIYSKKSNFLLNFFAENKTKIV